MENTLNKKLAALISFFFAIIAIHIIVFTYNSGMLIYSIVTAMDSLAAVFVGIRTDESIGHAAAVIGILCMLYLIVRSIVIY